MFAVKSSRPLALLVASLNLSSLAVWGAVLLLPTVLIGGNQQDPTAAKKAGEWFEKAHLTLVACHTAEW
jgi:hypothetical protein